MPEALTSGILVPEIAGVHFRDWDKLLAVILITFNTESFPSDPSPAVLKTNQVFTLGSAIIWTGF